jgi:hypothetical protein
VQRTRSRSPGGTGFSGAMPSRHQPSQSTRGAPSPERGRRTVHGNYLNQQQRANMTVATGDSNARAMSPPTGRGRLMEGAGTISGNTHALHSKNSASASDSMADSSLHLADSSMLSQADPWETPNTQNPSWNVNLHTAATASNNSASNNTDTDNGDNDTHDIEFNNYNDDDAAWFVAAPRSVSAVSQSAINANVNAPDWGSACGTSPDALNNRNGGQVAGFGGILSNDDDDQWNTNDNWFAGSKSNEESSLPPPTFTPQQQTQQLQLKVQPSPKWGSVERPIAIDDQGMDDALNARENDVLRLAARKSNSMNSLSHKDQNNKAVLEQEIDIDSRDQDVLQTAQRKFGSYSVAESNTGSNSNETEQPSSGKLSAKPSGSTRSPSRSSSVDTRSSMKQQVAPGSNEKKGRKGIWGLFGGVRYVSAVCALVWCIALLLPMLLRCGRLRTISHIIFIVLLFIF